IDVANIRRWAQPFVWIGMNCITIYMLAELLNFPDLVRRVLHDDTLALLGKYDELTVGVFSLMIAFWICWQLYRRKIFLRV
ncbi:MAG: hypothetical protein KDB23_33585, partial [Planctomycetales bacterium]|nr:hypothetical protein [Planctomycetales bacterium]